MTKLPILSLLFILTLVFGLGACEFDNPDILLKRSDNKVESQDHDGFDLSGKEAGFVCQSHKILRNGNGILAKIKGPNTVECWRTAGQNERLIAVQTGVCGDKVIKEYQTGEYLNQPYHGSWRVECVEPPEEIIAKVIGEYKNSNPNEKLYGIQNINLMSLHPEQSLVEKASLAAPIKAAAAKCESGSGEVDCFDNNPNKTPNIQTIAEETNAENKKKFMLIEVTGAPAQNNNHRQPGLYFVSNMEELQNGDPATLDLVGVQSVLHGGCILRDTSGENNIWFNKLGDANCLFHIPTNSSFYHNLGFVEDRFLTDNNTSIAAEESWFDTEHDSPGKFWEIVSPAVGVWHWVSTGNYLTQDNPADSSNRFYLQNFCKKSFDVDQMMENSETLNTQNLNNYASFRCSHTGYFFDNIALQINSLSTGWQIYQAAVESAMVMTAMVTGFIVMGPFIGPILEAASVGIGAAAEAFSSVAVSFTENTISFLTGSSELASLVGGVVSGGLSTTGSVISVLFSGPGIATAFLAKDSYEYSQCTTDVCKNKASVSMAIDAFFLGFEAYRFDVRDVPRSSENSVEHVAGKNEKVNRYIDSMEEGRHGEGGICLTGFGLTCDENLNIGSADSTDFDAYAKDNNSYIESTLDSEGQLSFTVQRNLEAKNPLVRGGQLVRKMMNHFGDSIKSVKGEWLSGTNLEAVNKFMVWDDVSTIGDEAYLNAAKTTWTANQMKKYGYSVVEMIQVDSNIAGKQVNSLRVKFTKP